MKSLSLQRMKNTGLPQVWEDLLLGPYDEQKRIRALQLILLFIASEDIEIRRLGYRLTLLYAKHTTDSSALHMVSSMIGLVPVSRMSEYGQDVESVSFVGVARESFAESMKDGEIYLTVGQKELKETFLGQLNKAVSIVAPTSYGKSSLMSSYLEATTGNFCTIVPTKSLLAQTRRMFLHQLGENSLKNRKIITHHEMYSEGDDNIIAVLTQERYLRLLQMNHALSFEHLVIDESHNLLGNEARSRALASSIVITMHRNKNARIKFLSPFVADSESLRNRIRPFDIIHVGTSEYVKSELIYYIDFRPIAEIPQKQQFVYDQFMDMQYPTGKAPLDSSVEYVMEYAGRKNIIYLNRPKNTHDVARRLIARLPDINSDQIQKACKDLGEYLHKDYFLIFCIKKGVVLHHGSVPDNVRLYLEQLYSGCPDVRYVITTSTLLEGVNLPADRMFLFDIKKGTRNLSASQLRNLIGRISRFKEVFAGTDVTALLPEIHFVGNEHYPATTKNILNYVKGKLREGKEAKDKVENPLLEHSKVDDIETDAGLVEELSFLGNSEEGILKNTQFEYLAPTTPLGRLCYLHRIADFNVLNSETVMYNRVVELQRLGVRAANAKQLIETVNEVFLKNLPHDDQATDDSITRLRDNFRARDFYAMILEWRTSGLPYQMMISRFIGYWKSIEDDPIKQIIYAGNWGNRPRTLDKKGENYVDIKSFAHNERVTLAVARIESEMAFLDFNVMRYIECLRELDLITPDYADQLKYGTMDPAAKVLVQAGMSHSLAHLMISDDFKKHILHFPSGAIGLSAKVIGIMEDRKINGVLVNEARYHTR